MTTFATFQNGPARELLARIGFDLSNCVSWADFRTTFIEQNREMRDRAPDDCLAIRARNINGVLSTGERAVLHAALAAVDFAKISDELWQWSTVGQLDRAHREAVAAAILRDDSE